VRTRNRLIATAAALLALGVGALAATTPDSPAPDVPAPVANETWRDPSDDPPPPPEPAPPTQPPFPVGPGCPNCFG
jgi:hypothetical protein